MTGSMESAVYRCPRIIHKIEIALNPFKHFKLEELLLIVVSFEVLVHIENEISKL